MPSQWVLSAWAHRRGLQENLRHAEAQVESLRESVDDARVAVHAALLAAETARTALEDAEATRKRLHEELSSLQLVFDPEVVAALPVEMLQAIFRELAFEQDPLWTVLHEGRYNRMRAGVPWRLAGVCRKWRRVAFDMPEIWSYIATPTVSPNNPTPVIAEKLVARMKLLLERSTTRAVDILLVCDDPQCRLADLDWFQEALNAAALCASRWRRVHLALPEDVSESELVFLRQPTPMLEEISVSVYDSMVPWKERYPAYLPSCPSLRTLWMSAIFTPPQSPLYLLTCAHLVVDDGCRDRLWNALSQMKALERLSIEFRWTERAAPTLAPTPHLRLGRLLCLEVSGFPAMVETWAHALEMPLLIKLVLRVSTRREIERIETFLSIACAGVVDLHIGSYVPDERMLGIIDMPRVFRQFPQVEHVTFFDCAILASTMDQLNTPPPQPVWPRLKSLTVERPAPRDEFQYFAWALVKFVGFRVPTRHYNNGGHAPLTVAITGIDVNSLGEDFDVGPPLRALEYVLGPQNSRFTASTGETIPEAADSERAESEDEAVLTESDDSEGEGSESSGDDDEDDGSSDSDAMDDETSEPERSLIVSGPNWDSDQSDDGDFIVSDESDADSEDVTSEVSGISDA